MGKTRRLSVAERAKIVTLNEEGYSERKISKKRLKFSGTAIHQTIAKFWEFSGLVLGLEDPGLTPKGMISLITR